MFEIADKVHQQRGGDDVIYRDSQFAFNTVVDQDSVALERFHIAENGFAVFNKIAARRRDFDIAAFTRE